MTREEQNSTPLIVDYIKAASWKHALFTTYALSLSYFESEILRPLLRSGCDDIWLIADAEGYRASLLERRSMRVGQEYRLIPCAMPNGVMHAKCIYLCNDEEDLLLIGSGNVTFGGHGKNAEVFEALTPDGAAQAFDDFAGFLESFGSRPKVRAGRREWIDDFAGRARRASTRGSDGESPVRLVHSLDTPVVDQLPVRFAGMGDCSKAIIMSPYHDPDGQAVRTLLEGVGIGEGAVAVSSDETTPFPFEQAASWSRPVAPVTLVQGDKRFVHAKWYEFEFAEQRVLLTGSINATRKALTTTDNAEIGVMRILPLSATPLAWKSADEPAFKAMTRLPSGLGSQEIVYAAFDRIDADKLNGQVISGQEVEGPWQLRLTQADGESFSAFADVDAGGRFSVSDTALEELANLPALQISLTRDGREARGWVHNEMLLSVGARRRLTAGALSRMMRREGTDDDLQALLDYLSINADQHLRLFDQPVGKSDESEEGSGGDRLVTVNIDEIAPLSENPDASETGFSGGGAAGRDDQFNRAILHIRRILLGHGSAKSLALESRSEETLAEEDLEGDGERTPEEKQEALGLSDFERAINAMIADAEERPEIVARLLVLLLEVSMWMRLSRLNDKDGAHDFYSRWFFGACRLGRCEPDRISALAQHVITAAAALYYLAPDTERHTLATALHDYLEKFYRGAVDGAHAHTCLMPDPHVGYGASLLGTDDLPDFAAALETILAIPTRRQQLDKALKLAEAGEPIPADWEVFGTETGKELLERLQKPHWEKRVKKGRPNFSACAGCHMAFARDEQGKYRRERFVRCIQCGKFTVDTNP